MAPQCVIRSRRKGVIPVELDRQKSMELTTQTVREQGFLPLEGDIPDGMTLAQYRTRRARRARVRRPWLRRRLARR
jgi:hypothetical protein